MNKRLGINGSTFVMGLYLLFLLLPIYWLLNMSLKTNLRQTTQSNYLYMYDRFIRDTFGKKKIAEIKYSRCASVLQLSAGQARLADEHLGKHSYIAAPHVPACGPG